MVDLAFDIWLHIASLTDPATIRQLYSVNSAFFRISMEQRYNVAYVSDMRVYTRNNAPFEWVTFLLSCRYLDQSLTYLSETQVWRTTFGRCASFAKICELLVKLRRIRGGVVCARR